MVGLSDLCFDPGIDFAKAVLKRFGCSVSLQASSPTAFVLVTSFGRSAIHLNVDSVGLLLQASIGGLAKDFNVVHLSGWMFRFSVSCKDVGFMIYKLKSFSCKEFVIFFSLWGNGGPNWCREHAIWCFEQDAELTAVKSRGHKSYADAVRSSTPSKPPNRGGAPKQSDQGQKKSVFTCISFPNDYQLNFLEDLVDNSQMISPPLPW